MCSKQFFTAEATPNGRIRVYIEVYYDNRWADARSAVLLLPHISKRDTREIVRTLVQEGYVVGVPDYCGTLGDGENSTSFPSGLSFCTYPECKKRLDSIEDTARNTPWFVWTKIARRAITLLEEQHAVLKSSIGVIGMGVGAHIAWQVAGMDKRVRALVPINGGGYRWAKDKPRFESDNIPTTDEERAFSTGVGAETYAKFVTCPTFYIFTRMSRFSDADRAGDIIGLVKTDKKQLLVSDGTDTQISRSALNTMLVWLRKYFALQSNAVVNPRMEYEVVEGKLYLHLYTAKKAESSVFISYGEPYSAARQWLAVKNLQKTGTHEYMVNIPVYNPDELIVSYATFKYSDGNMQSTPINGVMPSQMGLKAGGLQREATRVIYDGQQDPRLFLPLTDDFIVDDDIIYTKTGPFDIVGITAKKGGIMMCRSQNNIISLPRTSALHIDAYSPVPRTLTVDMMTRDNMKRFRTHVKLTGGEFWQKLIFTSSDFKSEEGRPLSSFAEAKIIAIQDAAGVICNNFLWI